MAGPLEGANPVRRVALASALGVAGIQAFPERLARALPDEQVRQVALVHRDALVRQDGSEPQAAREHAPPEQAEHLQGAERPLPQDAFLPAPPRVQNPEAQDASAAARELIQARKAQRASEHPPAAQLDAEHREPQVAHRVLVERKVERRSEPPGEPQPEAQQGQTASAALQPEMGPSSTRLAQPERPLASQWPEPPVQELLVP